MAIGVLIMYLLGSWLPWHIAAAVCIPVPCLLSMTLYFFWDSPYWYFQIGKDKSAIASLEQFRGKNAHVVSEVFQIQEQMRNETAAEEVSFTEGLQKIFQDKKYLKPFIILNSLFLLMLFSGKFAIDFYAVTIFKDSGANINEYLAAVIIAFIHLIGSLIFIPLIKRFPRKMLLILSSLVMGVSLLLLGVSVYYLNNTKVEEILVGFRWIPLISIVTYMVAAPIGLCSIPFMFIAEFYPTEMRSVLGGLTVAISNLELFLVVKTFPNLEQLMGEHGVFWLYSIACFGAIIFTLSYIPETKDWGLDQVQDKFSRLRKTARVTPRVSPLPSPNLSLKRSAYNRSQMFTQ
jgi:facilitated trehalose transporter